MLKKTCLVLIAAAALMTAQSTPSTDDTRLMIYPPPATYFDQVKQFLGLSDAQVEQLRQILSERQQATQDVYRQMQVKQAELSNLLEHGPQDAARIGTLNIEIYNLGKQAGAPDDSYRQRARAVLTPEQRTKLTDLDRILKLTPAANQAVEILLLAPLPPGPPVILATPAREAVQTP